MEAKKTHYENVLSWASDLDDDTLRQAAKAARLPIVAGPVALMPDAHVGLGATVGSVIPTDGAIIPAAVGVDIGCGMIAVETPLSSHSLPDDLRGLHDRITRVVPAGVGKGHERGGGGPSKKHWPTGSPATELPFKLESKSALQFGTLGSGNHFVEVCLDEHDRVWIVLHSGSRGVGNELAQRHISTAKGVMKEMMVKLEDPALAYLVEGTPEFDAYIADMLWAQDYALGNRETMMDAVLKQLSKELETPVPEVSRINCFAGETRVITRQGTRTLADLAGGVHELLTDGGDWVKAPVLSFGTQPLLKLTVTRCGVHKDIYATPGHNWILRSRNGKHHECTTNALRPGDRLATTFAEHPPGLAPDRDGVARGFVYGDGSAGEYRSRANFCGGKDEVLLPYFAAWNDPRTYLDGKLKVIHGLPKAWKLERPAIESDPSYLYGWLAGYFAADGDVDRSGRPTLTSARRENLEYVRDLANAIGIGTYGIREHHRKGYGVELSSLFLMGFMRNDLDPDFFVIPAHRERFEACDVAERRSWYVVSVEETDRVEDVFCATVDETHCFALEDNILTSNCHHNYSAREVHGGREVWLTRKGAIRARVGDRGVIPGSMGTSSYIVRGLGSAESYQSCSHGAGRRMSRTKARNTLDVQGLRRRMAGKAWNERDAVRLIDEDPRSYKDIDQVMADQSDLVEVEHTLHQILNYKGT